ncbi:MAG: hypothetical protein ABI618_18375, partial [Nitrospirota bacterium]
GRTLAHMSGMTIAEWLPEICHPDPFVIPAIRKRGSIEKSQDRCLIENVGHDHRGMATCDRSS